jgi:cyclophilin family peptidyl-prolyl cis-trans isomerase
MMIRPGMGAVNLMICFFRQILILISGFCRVTGFGIVRAGFPTGHAMKKLLLTLIVLPLTVLAGDAVPAHPYVKFETSEGNIIVELDGRRAPVTVANFLGLVDSGYYDGLIFHRVIANFMIQSGGYTPGLKLKEADEGSIFNESGNGLRNARGTIAMARTDEPHSAKAQFYINVNDNRSLDPQTDRWGYAVFGYVVEGMEVADAIASVRTGPQGKFSKDVPLVPVIINKASRHTFE